MEPVLLAVSCTGTDVNANLLRTNVHFEIIDFISTTFIITSVFKTFCVISCSAQV